jgi:hypothetical protein
MNTTAVFTSGAKSSEEKPRYDLIPATALAREAVRMGAGARAHGENNYQQGKDDPAFIRDRINHLIAHALNYSSGDRSDDHLAAIRCNAAMLMWIEAHVSEPFIITEQRDDLNIEPVGQMGYVTAEADRMQRA